jgi:hypothetical protein
MEPEKKVLQNKDGTSGRKRKVDVPAVVTNQPKIDQFFSHRHETKQSRY